MKALWLFSKLDENKDKNIDIMNYDVVGWEF